MKLSYCNRWLKNSLYVIFYSLIVHSNLVQAYTPQPITLTHNYLTIDPRSMLGNLTIAHYQRDRHLTQFIFQGRTSLMQESYALQPQIDAVSMGLGYRKLFSPSILMGVYNLFDIHRTNFVLMNPGFETYFYGFHLNLNAYISLGTLISQWRYPEEKHFTIIPSIDAETLPLDPKKSSNDSKTSPADPGLEPARKKIHQHYYLGESKFNWDCKLSYTLSKGLKLGGGVYCWKDYDSDQSMLGYMGRVEYAPKPSWSGYIQGTYDDHHKLLLTIGATWSPTKDSGSQTQNLLLKLPIDRHLISPFITFTRTKTTNKKELKNIYATEKLAYQFFYQFMELTKEDKVSLADIHGKYFNQLFEYSCFAKAYLCYDLEGLMNMSPKDFRELSLQLHPDKQKIKDEQHKEKLNHNMAIFNNIADTVKNKSDDGEIKKMLLVSFNQILKKHNLDPL